MKKLGIGCLIVFVLFAVGAGVLTYIAYERIYKPASQYVSSFKELGALADLEREVKNRAAFIEPEGGELSEELVERFVSVQEAMRQKLGSRLEGLKTKYEQIDSKLKKEGGKASFAEAMGGLKDLTSILSDAKHAQVEALNSVGFSVEEYEWVRNQVYAGLGMAAAQLDVKELVRIAQEGGPQIQSEIAKVPERNRKLISRYEKKLRDLAPLAFFGL